MKLGLFIVAALCVTRSADAAGGYAEQAAARSRAGDHAGAISLYRKAYEAESNPRILVSIAHEFRRAGDEHEALAYFCSYMYVDAAGELADEASNNARAISAKLGTPTQSDHEACTPRNARKPSPTVDVVMSLPAKPARIYKREILGLAVLGVSVASLGLAMLEARELREIHDDQKIKAPGFDQDALADRERSADLRQKMFLGLGGAALITGGIMYITGRNDRRKAERAFVSPTLMKGGAGIAAGRKF